MNDALKVPFLLTDTPEERDSEIWAGLGRFSQRLAAIVRELPATSAVLVSGDWGAGKTTVLRALERSLRCQQVEGNPVVWFEAWRFEGDEGLLPALVRSVWAGAPDSYRKGEDAKKLFATIWNCAVVVGLRALPILAGLAIGPSAALIAALSKDIGAKKLEDDLATGRPRDAMPSPSDSQLLWASFGKLVREAWKDQPPPVVLLDDLDRCNPDGAVKLLDDIRAIITGSENLHCRFVVALDRKAIVTSISKKFGGAGNYDGNRYLEKLFPMTFAVPALDTHDAAKLVELFLDRMRASDTALDDNHRSAIGVALGGTLFANPRLMKRCINRYRLVIHFEEALGSEQPVRLVANTRLASWIAATERWTILRRLIARTGDEFWGALDRAVKGDVGSNFDPDVQALLTESGAAFWLGQHLCTGSSEASQRASEYREADNRLRRWGL